jgi:hypothetical protein
LAEEEDQRKGILKKDQKKYQRKGTLKKDQRKGILKKIEGAEGRPRIKIIKK